MKFILTIKKKLKSIAGKITFCKGSIKINISEGDILLDSEKPYQVLHLLYPTVTNHIVDHIWSENVKEFKIEADTKFIYIRDDFSVTVMVCLFGFGFIFLHQSGY